MTIWYLMLYSHHEVMSTRYFHTEGQAYKALLGSLPADEWDTFDHFYIGQATVEGR